MTNNKINVLVVDDSRVARMLLVHLLESDPQIHVIGAVENGHAALDFLEGTKPTWSSWTSTCQAWTASRRRAASWKRNRCRSSFAPPRRTPRRSPPLSA